MRRYERKTKIVATLGPATDSKDMVAQLVSVGANVLRINLSHLEPGRDISRLLAEVKTALAEVRDDVAIMLDTRGPELRTGAITGGEVELQRGACFTITVRDVEGSSDMVSVSWDRFPSQVTTGDTLLVDDGTLELEVRQVSADDVECRVVRGGVITGRRKVAVVGKEFDLEPLGPGDRTDIKLAMQMNAVDMIALSFVRSAGDVLTARRFLEEQGSDLLLIAKIESVDGVAASKDILRVSDGLMVARGDLGVAVSAEEVPLVQKQLIALCNQQGKPVITATQMLESMIVQSVPTRAEASDVANAIFDGTDAVMLSGETAVGAHPLDAVAVMDRIARRIEQALDYDRLVRDRGEEQQGTVTDAISSATCNIAQALDADAIITATSSGHTARAVARYRPQSPIIAVSPDDEVRRRLSLVWGVHSVAGGVCKDTDGMLSDAVKRAAAAGVVRGGDLVVLTAGFPIGVAGTTNSVRVVTVGDALIRGRGVGGNAVTGLVVVAVNAEAAENVQPGDILVAPATNAGFVSAMKRAAAVIVEQAGLTSHTVLVALELGLPAVIGADGAVGRLKTGMIVTVDPERGLVYRGEAKV